MAATPMALPLQGVLLMDGTPMALPFQGVWGRITLLLPFSVEVVIVAKPRLACVLILVIIRLGLAEQCEQTGDDEGTQHIDKKQVDDEIQHTRPNLRRCRRCSRATT